MAMIDAYRIGVDLVLGGDLAAGIEALMPGLERLAAGVTHANAEAAGLAAGLRGVVDAAPGIGRAADQMDRLGAAMAGVNRAAEAWRSGGGAPKPARLGDDGAGPPRAEASHGTVLADNAPEAAPGLGAGAAAGARLKRSGQPPGPLDAVMPALLAEEWVKPGVETSAGVDAKRPALPQVLQAGALARDVAGRMPDPATRTGVLPASELVTHALPDYAREALQAASSGPSGPADHRLAVPFQAARGGAAAAAKRVSGEGSPGRASTGAAEGVLPDLAGPGGRAGARAATVEPRQRVQPPFQLISDTLRPQTGALRRPAPMKEQVGGLDAVLTGPALVPEQRQDVRRTSPGQGAVRGAGEAGSPQKTLRPGRSGMFDSPAARVPVTIALDGISLGRVGLGASALKDALPGLTAREQQRGLFAQAGGIAALSGKMPPVWPGVADIPAAKAPRRVGAGFAPAPAAPPRDQSRRLNGAPPSHGYHPQGDRPGPVIEHITYIHLDEREIARAVTRQQLRMMGGNVAGTLRPDPSIAPQYGAHLVET